MTTATASAPSGPVPPGVRTLRELGAVEALRDAAQARNRRTATLLRRLHEAGRACADGPPRPELDRFSADEVSAALGWSAAMAGRWLQLADDLVVRLPAVLAAMTEGSLDDTKARVLSEWTRDLGLDHARRVCALVLGQAPGLPVGALIDRVQELAVALDPEWAARREARARRRARVVGSVNPDGTATLAGYDLPLDESVEALAHVETLADRVRARGVSMPIAQLRSAVYLRLLDGFGAGLDDDTLVEALAALLRDDPGPDDGPGPGPADSGPDNGPGTGPTDTDPTDDGPGDGPGDDGSGRDETADAAADGGAPSADGPGAADEDPRAPAVEDPPPPNRRLRRGTTELRVRLSTLLGLDDLPAHVPTWGTVLARTARDWARDHPRAEWRLVVTDDQGRLLHVLLTRHRPPGPRSRGTPSRGIVEIQVPATLLAGLEPDDHPGWTALLTDARRRVAGLPPDGCPDRRPAARDAAGRRRAHAELIRWVQVRDRHCAAPGCRRPAVACDLDHTNAWAAHGPTAAGNLGALCRRHHRLKHRGGWTLVQPSPGVFVWRTRAGRTYLLTARPVTEALPAPDPRASRRPLGPDRTVPAPRRGMVGSPASPRREHGIPAEHLDGGIVLVGRDGGSPRPPGPAGGRPDRDDPPPF